MKNIFCRENKQKDNDENPEDKLKYYHGLIFFNLVLTFVLASFVGYDCYMHYKSIHCIDFDFNSCSCVTTILSIIGLLLAFTAMSIYSVYNSRIIQEKDSLYKARTNFEKYLDKINELESKLRDNTHKINEQISVLSQNVLINQITNSYISISDKVTAIRSLTQQIEKFETDICTTDYIVDQNDLKGALYEFSRKIKMALDSVTVPLDANELYRNSFKILKDKVQEIIDKGVLY